MAVLRRRASRFFRRLVNTRWPRVWEVNGHEKHAGEPLRLLIAARKVDKSYLTRLLLRDGCQQRYLGRKGLARLRRLVAQRPPAWSLAVLPRRLQAPGDFLIPQWVSASVDIPLRPTSNSGKHDLRIIKRHRLDYRVTRAEGQVATFYDRMYLPFVQKRHGDGVILQRREDLLRLTRQGHCELVMVTRDEEVLAGTLLMPHESPPRLWLLGVRDGDEELLSLGVLPATYFFSAQVLSERGWRCMSVGSSRAFCSDGVLSFKLKWSPTVTGHLGRVFVLRPLAAPAQLRSFYVNNSFLHLVDGRLERSLFVAGQPPANRLAALCRKRWLEGLARLSIYRLTADSTDFEPLRIRTADGTVVSVTG